MVRRGDVPQQTERRLSRRELLRAAALGGGGLLGAYLVACGGSKESGGTATVPPVTASAAPALSWRRLSPAGELPPARRDHSLVTDGQKLYVFGGRGPTALGDLWAFDIATSQWSNKLQSSDGPPARFGHNAIWDPARARMVIFGGQNGSDFYNDYWEYDPVTSTWNDPLAHIDQPASVLPTARYGAGGAFDLDGHLLITHGFTSQGRFDDTWQLGLGGFGWQDISPRGTRPIKRCLMRAVWDTLKSRLLIFGGQSDDTPFLDDVWSWSTERGWAYLARDPHPSARTLYSMIYDNIKNQAVLFAGNTADRPVNDLWSFHSSGENWTQIPTEGTPPEPRFGHDAAFVSENAAMFVFGGVNGPTLYDDLWVLSA